MAADPDLALQDLLKLREREVDFLSALRELIESNWRLKLQVEDLQKRLKEKDGELTEANETIEALRADVHTLQKQVELQKSNGKDVLEQAPHTSDNAIQAEVDTDPPTTPTSSTRSIICLEADSGTKKRSSLEVSVGQLDHSGWTLRKDPQGHDDSVASDADDADNDGDNDSDYTPRSEDIHSCSDDNCMSTPSKKQWQEKRTTVKRRCHTCGVCNKSFWKLAALRLHQRKHNDKKTSPQKRQPKRQCQLAEEQNVVEEEEEQRPSCAKPHKCKECGKSFMTISHLRAHHRIHTGEKPYPCSLCEKTFAQKASAVTHLVSHASKATPVPCPHCKVTFTSSILLRQHIMAHRKEKRGVCSKCDLTFPSRAELKRHKVTHDAERTLSCAYCDKKFRNTSGLKDHERTHTGEKPYLCDDCGRSFSCAQHLKTHRRTHTGEKPFRCDECGESFAQGITLRKHQLRHTGERPHLCSLCGKAFARPEVLKTHLRVHTGEKPYTCPQCGQRFGYVRTLQSHQLRMHPEAEVPVESGTEATH
ncbi:hypothetical protein ACEWY4_017724 [Coilia grayii]|uniref:C2H2-type domain-containing protein n=1 Tax=Coilia grayii TaxID=363190 RepID=A0ABD1JJ53_9TELE